MWMASTTAGTGDIRVNTSPSLRSTRGRQPATYTGCAVTTIPVTRSEKTGGSACLSAFRRGRIVQISRRGTHRPLRQNAGGGSLFVGRCRI